MAKPPTEIKPDFVYGTNGNDVLYDTALGTVVHGYEGDDVIFAADAVSNDYYHVDEFFGANGTDTVSYTNVTGLDGIVANLNTGEGYRTVYGEIPGDVQEQYYHSIENIEGSQQDDSIAGDGNANRLEGWDGDDVILGLAGEDFISGDRGNDELHGGDGKDTILAGTGDDEVSGGDDDDYLSAGAGNDKVVGGDGGDRIFGGADDDKLWGEADNDKLDGEDGNDEVFGGDGEDLVKGGKGDDLLRGDAHNDELQGGAGDDILEGGTGDDILDGGDHDDFLIGGSGNDTINGGSGEDLAIYQADGDVTVSLYGGYATGAAGSDTLFNVENVKTGVGNDTIFGSSDDNSINTGNGNDTVFTIGGDNQVFGGDHDDTLIGAWGEDELNGNQGNDYLSGGDANDILIGGAGIDTIIGGSGADIIETGQGADIVRWENGETIAIDSVLDFEIGTDVLEFGDGFLVDNPAPEVDLDSLFDVISNQAGDARLLANTASDGWQAIANFDGVSVEAMSDAIANGSLVGIEVGQLVTADDLAPVV